MTDRFPAFHFTTAGAVLNRRRLLALPVGALALAACGGSPPPTDAPASVTITLDYDSDQPLYVTNEAITPNHARPVGGGAALTFSVAPPLPNGLSLDARTGLISGTPTTLQRQATYTVTARDGAASAQARIRITVTARGTWSNVATVPVARHYATLTPLADGRFLAAGGTTAGGVTASAEIYDPVTSTWSAAAPMLQVRSDPTAVALLDGRVLVFGGDDGARNTTASAELYDPVADTWTATGGMGESRVRPTAHRLADGRVLVAGGFASTPLVFRDTVEVYDPATGLWATHLTRLSAPRAQHASALLPGGSTLLVAGGVNRLGFVTTAELFAVDDSGTSVIPYGIGGNVHTAVVLDDGSVLVTSDGSANAQRFNPATSTWTPSTMSAPRSLLTLTLLSDGRVLAAGGSNLNTAEIYNPDVNLWTAAAPMADARRAHVAALLADGGVLAMSGSDAAGEVDASERYSP